MSDLAATNCGCGCDGASGISNLFGGGNCGCLVLILLLMSCGGCGEGLFGGCEGGNNSCLWIILLLLFCGGGCGTGCGC